MEPSPTRSQNSSPGLLSDYDRVSNCSSSFTSKTSSSSSDRCDDVKSQSSLLYLDLDTENHNSPFQLCCLENIPNQIYLNDTSTNIETRKNPSDYCYDRNHKVTKNDVNSNKCMDLKDCDIFDNRFKNTNTPPIPKNNYFILSKVDVNGPRRHDRRHKRTQSKSFSEQTSDSDKNYSQEHRNSDDNSLNGCDHNSQITKHQLHNCCDLSPDNNSVWVLRSDLRKPHPSEDRKGRVFDGYNRFDDIHTQLSESLSTSSSSLPLTQYGNTNIRKSHSNINHRSTCNMFITDLGNKSSSAPVLKKVNESQELLSSHIKVS